MKFSIILPSHNGAERIGKALRACMGQTYDDFEVIVVCDSCTDNTAKIAEEYGCKVASVSCHNDGLARNVGLDIATGDWVLFIDDDDWWMHEYVFQLLAEMTDRVPDCDAIFFSILKRGVGYVKQTPEYQDPLVAGHCWKREFIGDTRFPDPSYGSDNQFFFSMMQKGPDVVFWDNLMYYYNYMRGGSMSDRHRKGEI